ncbi:MAG: zinc-binding dehydrogenase [bacterium]
MLKVKKMRAAILTELHQPLVIDEVSLPEELEYGQVLVKIFYSGICGSQLGEINGVKGEDRYLPHLLGHEGSGEVLEIAKGVKHVKIGDHVVMHWKKGDGIESAPPVYMRKGERVNAGFLTTFNEYAIVSENRLTSIPEDFDLALAPLFGCAVTTGFGVVTNNAHLKIGESIVVFGAGGIGLNVIQAAALHSAYPIVAVDIFDNKLELAQKFGATHTLNAQRNDIPAALFQIVGAAGADVAVDNTGNTKIIECAYQVTHGKGRTILVGVPRKGDTISLYSLPLHFGKVLTGSCGGDTNPSIDIPRYIRLKKAGKLKLNELITNRYSFCDLNTAIEKMSRGEIAGRCLIEIHPTG